MLSARAAAEAVLNEPAHPAAPYLAYLAATQADYNATTAPVHEAMVGSPRVVAGVGRLLTAPGLSRALAGGWSVYWNDLTEGASPGWGRALARVATRAGRIGTRRTRARRWLGEALGRRVQAAADAGADGATLDRT